MKQPTPINSPPETQVPVACPQLRESSPSTEPPPSLPSTPARNTNYEDAPQPTPTRLSFGALPPSPLSQDSEPDVAEGKQPPVVFSPRRQSSRVRIEQKMYDADSGLYKIPSSVPEDV